MSALTALGIGVFYAQVAVAFWRQGKGLRVIGMRSTADYLQLILENAAMPGSDLQPR